VIAIVIALRSEAEGFLRASRFERVSGTTDNGVSFESRTLAGVAVIEAGVGRARAEAATRLALERYRPDLVVSAGFAGAARPGLSAGHLVLCDSLCALEGPPSDWTPQRVRQGRAPSAALLDRTAALLGGLGGAWSRGGCISVDALVSEPDAKAWLGRNLPVSVVDMESFWVCQEAERSGVPYLALRAVLDPAGQAMPAYVGLAVADPARQTWRSAAAHLLRRPADSPALMRLALQYRLARGTLAAALEAAATSSIVPDLASIRN
jgi:adenosylhomocysteine nucleosidase